MTRNSSRKPCGFTLIEMVAVLFLAGLLSCLAVFSLAGPLHSAELGDVDGKIAFYDSLFRQAARHNHVRLSLVLNASEQAILDPSVSPPHVVYRIPTGWNMDRFISAAGNEDFDALNVSFSASGLSPSYAVRFSHGSVSHWLVMCGMTGQIFECDNEQEAKDFLLPTGNDSD